MKIREAIWEDASVIAAFNVALARESENLELEPARVRAGVEALLRDSGKGIYFIAEVNGERAGQLLVTHEWSDWRNGDFWWLQSVYVAPGWRRQGVFKGLLEFVVARARQRADVCGLRLYMEAGNARARAAYERLGFQETHYRVFEQPL